MTASQTDDANEDDDEGTLAAPVEALAAPALPLRWDFRLLAVSAAGFCVFLSVYATQPLLPLLARLFHASEEKVSLTVTATTVAVAIAAPFIGLLAERVGRKVIIVAAIFLLVIPTLGAATSHTLGQLIAWRFLQGLIMPGIIAVTMAYVTEEWPPDHVGGAMAAYVSGNVLAGVTGRFLSGWIAGHYRWQWSFVALAVLDVAGGVLVWRGLPPSRRQEAVVHPPLKQALGDMARHFRNPPLLAAYAAGAAILLALVAMFTYITFRLAGPPFHLGPQGVGSLFLVYFVGVVVTPIGGRFIDRYGQRKSLQVSLFVIAGGLLLTLLPWLWAVVVGLAVGSSGVFISQSSAASYMGLAAGKARASAAGLYATFYYLGGAAGAFVPGLFWPYVGWPGTVVFILAALAITGIVVRRYWVRRDLLVEVDRQGQLAT
jgi:YNFM family putative membrane transporter